MKFLVFLCILAVAVARPQQTADVRTSRSAEADIIKIIRDDRVPPQDGSYSFDFETENGIVRSESGSALKLDGAPVGQQGSFSFPLPNGEIFTMKFVANENGFQPESPFLPVAPEFPHPIPQFVLDQIEKARREDEEAARQGGQRSSAVAQN